MAQKTGRKLLSVLLTLAMILGLVPGMGLTALAADPETYNLWVYDTQVTSANAADVFSDGKVSFTPATLTLNGYSYEGAGRELNAHYYGILNTDNNMPLLLKLEGANSIKVSGGTGLSYAIYSASKLTIDGTGSIEATADGDKDYAIYVSEDLTVTGGTVNAADGQYGLATTKNFKADGSGVVIHASSKGTSEGTSSAFNVIASAAFNAGTVTAQGKNFGITCATGMVRRWQTAL